jgi:hypothetical protein
MNRVEQDVSVLHAIIEAGKQMLDTFQGLRVLLFRRDHCGNKVASLSEVAPLVRTVFPLR